LIGKGESDSSLYYNNFTLGTHSWGNINRKLKQPNKGFYLSEILGLTGTFALDSLVKSNYDIIEFYAKIESLSLDEKRDLVLVIKSKKGNELVKWSEYSSKNATSSNQLELKIVNAQNSFGDKSEIPNIL
jgi:hypothetical protein|tara:strand:- start:281 stop:670 length:390 start_codon:yes stop_codon:yes gene_type:complete